MIFPIEKVAYPYARALDNITNLGRFDENTHFFREMVGPFACARLLSAQELSSIHARRRSLRPLGVVGAERAGFEVDGEGAGLLRVCSAGAQATASPRAVAIDAPALPIADPAPTLTRGRERCPEPA
jgi:hypothetical protein